MSDVRTLHRSFAGGEITPELYGRLDLDKFQTGLADCRNFVVLPHGPITRRPGTKYIIETKFSEKQSRLIPFVFSSAVTYLLEFGDEYIRFHSNGSTIVETEQAITSVTSADPLVFTVAGHGFSVDDWVILDGVDDKSSRLEDRFLRVATVPTADTFTLEDLDGEALNSIDLVLWSGGGTVARVYEISSPYDADAIDLLTIHYAQANDTLTLTHPNYEPRELSIAAPTNWTLDVIDFGSQLSNPGVVSATADVNEGAETETLYRYTVTAATKDGDESGGSADGLTLPNTAPVSGRLWNAGNRISIDWSSVGAADYYNVYKSIGVPATGLIGFGLIGRTDALSLTDDNIAPDFSIVPPQESDPFPAADDFPAATTYFEQRRVFGGTNNRPQNMWLTKIGTDSNMSSSFPVRADDAIEFRIASRQLNTIKHIVATDDLLAFTGAAVWRVWSKDSDALTPTTISVRPSEYIGANDVQPVVAGGSVLFCESRGAHIYEVKYSWEKSGYRAEDDSVLAPHLFDGFDIVDMSYAIAPHKVVWAARSDGTLLGMTYLPQHRVRAWHRHDTSGEFECVVTVPEGDEDGVYFIVNRMLRGKTVRTIERLNSSAFEEQADAFFVDCGGTYDDVATDEISGLWWLEGETVTILADGAVVGEDTVAGGKIQIAHEASTVQIGLPMTSQAKTLPLVYEAQDFGQGVEKNVNRVNIRVRNSSGIFAGPSYDDLTEFQQRTTEPYGSPPELFTGVAEIDIQPGWNTEGQVCIQASDPLPLTVLSMSLDVALGG